MKLKRLTALLTCAVMTASVLAGCGGGAAQTGGAAADGTATDAAATEGEATASGDIKEFDAFFAMPATVERTDDNEVKNMIAEKTGVKVKETWLTGQTDVEAIGTIIAGGEYPDFINGGEAMAQLYEAGALVPWDEYLEKYPNIKNYYTDAEWEKFRQDDGHIYWANAFQHIHGEDKTTTHNDEAFWIQTRVLEWAGYPIDQGLQ